MTRGVRACASSKRPMLQFAIVGSSKICVRFAG